MISFVPKSDTKGTTPHCLAMACHIHLPTSRPGWSISHGQRQLKPSARALCSREHGLQHAKTNQNSKEESMVLVARDMRRINCKVAR